MLVEDNKLASSILLDEVVEFYSGSTHHDYNIILARGSNITFLRGGGKRWYIVRIEKVSLQGVGGCCLERNRLHLSVLVRLRERFGYIYKGCRNQDHLVSDGRTVSISVCYITDSS